MGEAVPIPEGDAVGAVVAIVDDDRVQGPPVGPNVKPVACIRREETDLCNDIPLMGRGGSGGMMLSNSAPFLPSWYSVLPRSVSSCPRVGSTKHGQKHGHEGSA